MSCDPSTLANLARCFDSCIPPGMQQAVKTSLLCQWANLPTGPEAPFDFDLEDSSVDNQIDMSWTNPGDPTTTANEIWRSVNGAAFVMIASVGPLDTTYSDLAPQLSNPGDYVEWKVQAVSASGSSDFSNARGASLELGALALTDYDYPFLVFNFGALDLTDNLANSANFPLLRRVETFVDLSGPLNSMNLNSLETINGPLVITNTNLTAISFPVLTTGVQDLNVTQNGSLVTFSCAVLPTMSGALDGSGTCPALETISLPLLVSADSVNFSGNASLNVVTLTSFEVTVGGDFNFSGCPSLTTLTIPALQTCTGQFNLADTPNLGVLNASELISATDVVFSNCGCVTIDFTNLGSVGGELNFLGCTGLTDFSFDNLITVAASIVFTGCTALDFCLFPNLTSLGENFFASGCTSMQSCSMPVVIFQDGFTVNIQGAQVSDVTINQILARGIASGTGSSTYTLDGGSNAAPTGQGITDKGDLITAGNVVDTN